MRGVIRGEGKSKSYLIDGKEVTEKEFFEAFPRPSSSGRAGSSFVGWKPIVSDALAVHPKQVKEAMELAAKRGVPTEFLPDGRPVLRTRKHRAAFLKAHGYFDRDAGYGDPADGSCNVDVPDRPDFSREIFGG